MKIGLAYIRHSGTGGVERYLNSLSAYLAELGHSVAIVCRRHEEAPHPDVRFVRLRGRAIGSAWRTWVFAADVARHVAEGDYDVFIGLGNTWSQDVLRLGMGCKRTYLELAHPATLTPFQRLRRKGFLKHHLAERIERRALAPGAYRRLIANSEMVKRDVMARYAVPADAIRVIHNGADLERFHPRRRATSGLGLRESIGLEPADLAVLFLGTGYGRKGLDLVLAAFAEIAGARPDARLVVVGYDSSQARFERLAEQLGIGHLVRFLGGRRDAEDCYAAADLYVLPTRYDPFANSTIEALASGLPVITSDQNGGSELLEAGDAGSVVPLAAGAPALATAIESWLDPDRLAAGSRAARALAEQNGIESKMELAVQLIEDVANER